MRYLKKNEEFYAYIQTTSNLEVIDYSSLILYSLHQFHEIYI